MIKSSRIIRYVHPALIVLAAFLAYANTFNVSFHFDDLPSIRDNPVIRDFQYFSAAIRLRPLGEKARFNLGLSYLAKGEYGQARKEFETVQVINPGNYEAGRFLEYLSSLK